MGQASHSPSQGPIDSGGQFFCVVLLSLASLVICPVVVFTSSWSCYVAWLPFSQPLLYLWKAPPNLRSSAKGWDAFTSPGTQRSCSARQGHRALEMCLTGDEAGPATHQICRLKKLCKISYSVCCGFRLQM